MRRLPPILQAHRRQESTLAQIMPELQTEEKVTDEEDFETEEYDDEQD